MSIDASHDEFQVPQCIQATLSAPLLLGNLHEGIHANSSTAPIPLDNINGHVQGNAHGGGGKRYEKDEPRARLRAG